MKRGEQRMGKNEERKSAIRKGEKREYGNKEEDEEKRMRKRENRCGE